MLPIHAGHRHGTTASVRELAAVALVDHALVLGAVLALEHLTIDDAQPPIPRR